MANVQVTIKKGLFNELFSRDVLFHANTRLQAYCDPYVPFYDSSLSSNVTVTAEAVTYNEVYAHYVHEGKLFLAKNGSCYAKKGEKKHPTNTPLNYTTDHHPLATKKWEKAMAAAKGQALADDIQNFVEAKHRG